MNNAKVSSFKGKQEDVFLEMVEAVFLYIREHHGEYNAIIKDSHINYTQYIALLTIFLNNSLTEGELAKMILVNPSTVSRMVYDLEEKGWVKSERDRADRRRVIVRITATGKRRMGRMRKKQAEVLAREVEGLDEEKREYVFKVAQFVNQALRYMMAKEPEGTGE